MALGSEKSPVLFIVADAFRHDYLDPERTPTLCELARKGCYIHRLRPNFGFCERTEMFTGSRPDKNGFFTALTYRDRGSAFLDHRFEIRLLSLLDWKKNFLRRYIRRFYRDWFRKIRGVTQPVYEIPLRLLPRIALTEDERELHLPGWSDTETLFDVMRESGLSFYFDTFASLTMTMTSDEERASRLCRLFGEKYFDLYLIYVGEGDGTGHDFGPHSPEARRMNRNVDGRIQKLSNAFFRAFPGGRLVAIGDHGMLEVKQRINVDALIFDAAKKAGLEWERDFDYFLDSTMARIWFRKPEAREIFSGLFRENGELESKGRILTPQLTGELHVPPPGSGYGDLLWLANPGVLIFPDFFHFRKPCLGMHGYDTSVSGQKGFAVVAGEGIEPLEIGEAEVIDVCPTLCRLLGIREPRQCQGKGFVK